MYGAAGTSQHQEALGLILFLVNCYQRYAVFAFHKAFLLAGITFCGNRVCQGYGYYVSLFKFI
jgi:hypothetical protein